MIVAQTELSVIGLVVQGGFAALCGFMVYAQEQRARRDAARRDVERLEANAAFAAKDAYIKQLVANNHEQLKQAIQAQDRSTEVARQVVEVIKKCSGPAGAGDRARRDGHASGE